MPSEKMEDLFPTPEEQAKLKRKLILMRIQRDTNPKEAIAFARNIYKQFNPLGEELGGPVSDEKALRWFDRIAGLDPDYQDLAWLDDDFFSKNLEAAINEQQYGSPTPSKWDIAKKMYDMHLAPLVGATAGYAAGGPLGAVFGSMHKAETAPQDIAGWATLGASTKIPAISQFLSRGGPLARGAKEGLYAAGEGALQREVSGQKALDPFGLASDFGTGTAIGGGMSAVENLMSRALFKSPAPSNLLHQDVPVEIPLTTSRTEGTSIVPGESVLDVFKAPKRIADFQRRSGLNVDPRTVTEGQVPLLSPEQDQELANLFDQASQDVSTPPVSVATPRPEAPLPRSASPGQAPVTPITLTQPETRTRMEGGTTQYGELPDLDLRSSRSRTGTDASKAYQRLKELARSPRSDEMSQAAPVTLALLGDLRDIFQSGGEDTFLKVIEANKLGGSQNNFTTRQAKQIPTAAKQLAEAIPGLPEDRAAKLLTVALTYGSTRQVFDKDTLKNLVNSVDLDEDALVKELVGPYQPVKIAGTEVTETLPGKVEFDLETSRKRETASAERLAQQVPQMEQANLRARQGFEQKLGNWEAREAARTERLRNYEIKKAQTAQREAAVKIMKQISGKDAPPTAQEITKAAIQNPQQAVKRLQALLPAVVKTPKQEIDLRTNLLIDLFRELQDPGTIKALMPGGSTAQTRLKPDALESLNKLGARPQGTNAEAVQNYMDFLTGSREASDSLVQALNTEGLLNEIANQKVPEKLRYSIRTRLMNFGTRLHYGRSMLDFAADFQRPTAEQAAAMDRLRNVSKHATLFGRTARTEAAKTEDDTSAASAMWTKLKSLFGSQ